MGYGKAWQDMYNGSMFGESTDVMAVWGYVIAAFRVDKSIATVELNPVQLSAQFSATPERMWEAIQRLMAEDPASRNKDNDGRRLVLDTHENPRGPMTFIVPSGPHYRNAWSEGERRSAKSASQAKWRANKKAKDGDLSLREVVLDGAPTKGTALEHPITKAASEERLPVKRFRKGFVATAKGELPLRGSD